MIFLSSRFQLLSLHIQTPEFFIGFIFHASLWPPRSTARTMSHVKKSARILIRAMDGKEGSRLNRDGDDNFRFEKIFLNAGESNCICILANMYGSLKNADTFGFTSRTYQRFSYVSFFTRLYAACFK